MGQGKPFSPHLGVRQGARRGNRDRLESQDPLDQLGKGVLDCLRLDVATRRYETLDEGWLEPPRLRLTLWEGLHEGKHRLWIRWCDAAGRVLPTGAEGADAERQRAERLAARLRELGEDPEA